MAKITRLGAYGGPRSLYGTFSGKEAETGAQDIQPTGIASAEAFGTAVVTTGAVDIAPTGIASAEAFGTAAITSTVDIAPTGIVSAEAFGTAVITQSAAIIAPTGIVSAEAFGTVVVTGGAITIDKVQFGKKFYELDREKLSLQMRQEDEEILALIQIIGKYLL